MASFNETKLNWLEAVTNIANFNKVTRNFEPSPRSCTDLKRGVEDIKNKVAAILAGNDEIITQINRVVAKQKVCNVYPTYNESISYQAFAANAIETSEAAWSQVSDKIDECLKMQIDMGIQLPTPLKLPEMPPELITRNAKQPNEARKMIKCNIKTIQKNIDVMPGGEVNAIHYFSIGKDKFKVESDVVYKGVAKGFILEAWDRGWNEIKFFPATIVGENFKNASQAKTKVEESWKKVEAFASKFVGCD